MRTTPDDQDDVGRADLADEHLDEAVQAEGAPRTGIFIGLSSGAGGSAGGALSGGFSALDEVFNPAAARARDEWARQHEAVIPTPSPGDRMLDEGRIVIAMRLDEDAPARQDSGERGC